MKLSHKLFTIGIIVSIILIVTKNSSGLFLEKLKYSKSNRVQSILIGKQKINLWVPENFVDAIKESETLAENINSLKDDNNKVALFLVRKELVDKVNKGSDVLDIEEFIKFYYMKKLENYDITKSDFAKISKDVVKDKMDFSAAKENVQSAIDYYNQKYQLKSTIGTSTPLGILKKADNFILEGLIQDVTLEKNSLTINKKIVLIGGYIYVNKRLINFVVQRNFKSKEDLKYVMNIAENTVRKIIDNNP
jgi:hypothetical protein